MDRLVRHGWSVAAAGTVRTTRNGSAPWYNMTALPSSYRAAGVFGDGRGDTMIWGDGIAVRCR
jgi:hypothetical protein